MGSSPSSSLSEDDASSSSTAASLWESTSTACWTNAAGASGFAARPAASRSAAARQRCASLAPRASGSASRLSNASNKGVASSSFWA